LGNQGFLNQMIKHWIFDLDGTVIDTVIDLARAISDTLVDFDLPPVTVEETKRFLGGGARQFVQLALSGKNDDPVFFKTFFAAYLVRYQAYQLQGSHPYSGVKALLTHLKQTGMKTYIFSNKPHDLTIQLIDVVFPGLFTGVHGHIPGTPLKPDPTMYYPFASTYGIDPKEAVFIGDSPPDIEMGQRLGMPTVAVSYGYTELSVLTSYQPTVIVDTVEAIYDAVKQIEKKQK
jgi:phosphoglycolate phosphatase